MGRSFTWEPSKAVVIQERNWSALDGNTVSTSPLNTLFRTNKEIVTDLRGTAPLPFGDLEGLRRAGYTGWVGEPMRFSTGDVHGITFATKSPNSFTEEHVTWLRQLVRPLSRIGEIFALRRNAANLLSAYVGRNAGGRVLSGNIHLGDTEAIRCVVWFSDLRSFTSMSSRLEPAQIIALLNEVFACQVAPIEAAGGEVLKFMGDGLLAIFPIDDKKSASAACAASAGAATEAQARLVTLNSVRASDPLHFGIALHLGEVAYGNIGGGGRLDFTCIGSTVNTASRIEGLTGKLGRPVLVSEEFAKASGLKTRKVGEYELKGVPVPQPVHELM